MTLLQENIHTVSTMVVLAVLAALAGPLDWPFFALCAVVWPVIAFIWRWMFPQ